MQTFVTLLCVLFPLITSYQFKSYNFHNIHINTIFVTNRINGFDDLGIILDDDSFKKLIPNWNIDFNKLGNPIKDKMRHLALMKILYNYGT